MASLIMTETAQPLIQQATALTVKIPADRQKAADLWDAIRAFRKQAEAQKEEIIRPLKTAWDDAKVPFDRFIKECQGHEATLTMKMQGWDREQDRLAKVEQARLQAITERANAKIEAKAEEKGIDPVFKVAPVVAVQPKSIETQAGTMQTRQTKKVYKIKGANGALLDASSPLVAELLTSFPALFVLDTVKFNALAKTGMLDGHPNVERTEEYVYSQR